MDAFSIVLKAYSAIQLLLSIPVVILNTLFLTAFAKKRPLHTPSNSVLVCLSCSDLLIGILSFILGAIDILRTIDKSIDTWTVYNVLFYKFLALTGVSSLFMTVVNLDRFAAICYPYQYVQYATAKIYVVIYISTCLIFTLLMCASFLFNPAYRPTYAVSAFFVVISTCALTLTLCNWKIFIVIRRHRREIRSVARDNSESYRNGPQLETKRHRIVVLLVVVFVFCNLPHIISRVILVALNMQYKMELEIFAIASDVLLLLNSLINPIVYYYRIQVFRSATEEILCCHSKVGGDVVP